MINIRWQDKFSVGNEKIDNEHKTFVELIRAASEAIDQECGSARIERLLRELELYARFHFFSEETLMIESGYPGYEAHRAMHQKLLDNLAIHTANYRLRPESGSDMIMFLFSWFAEHTTETDLELARYLD